MTPKLTQAGYQMMSRALAGTQITFTRFEIGNGEMPEDYAAMTAMANKMQEIAIDSIEIQPKFAVMTGTLNNAEITDGFQWTEIGIFCADPDGGTDDILYAYGHYKMDKGAQPTWIPKFSNDVVELTLNEYIYIGEAEDVTAALSQNAAYTTKAEFTAHTADENNPHKVTAAQVGLENVPNVSTDDQTPTVEPSETLQEISDGNTLKTIIGRVAKAVSSLIEHLRDTAAHVSKYDRTIWNNKANGTHNHSANNITSGVLGLTRGGTGAGDAASARRNLIGTTKIGGSNNPIYWDGSQFTKMPYTIAKSVPKDANFDQYVLPSASPETKGGAYMTAGILDISTVKAGEFTDVGYPFSSGTFLSDPYVILCEYDNNAGTSVSGNTARKIILIDRSTKGFTVRAYNNSGSSWSPKVMFFAVRRT